jgi:hypothetical protein
MGAGKGAEGSLDRKHAVPGKNLCLIDISVEPLIK